jgi:hypothetical protein
MVGTPDAPVLRNLQFLRHWSGLGEAVLMASCRRGIGGSAGSPCVFRMEARPAARTRSSASSP